MQDYFNMTILKSIIALIKSLWKKLFHKKAIMPELAWNPFVKYPRNEECYCGSSLKYKKCCLKTEARIVPKVYADAITPLVKKVRSGRLA